MSGSVKWEFSCVCTNFCTNMIKLNLREAEAILRG